MLPWVMLWPLPAATVTVAGLLPGWFVKANRTLLARPLTIAVTLKLPATVLAVNAGAVAMPVALVCTLMLPPNVPDAPLTGVLKVTQAPLTGLPAALVTRTCKAVLNG